MTSRFFIVFCMILWVFLGTGCSSLLAISNPAASATQPLPSLVNPINQEATATLNTAFELTKTVDLQSIGSPAASTQNLITDPFPPISSPTSLAYNPSATPSPSPFVTNTPGPTDTPYRRATRTPTITPTPPIPSAGVQFAEPGPMSKVVSPLHMVANLRSVPSGTYRVEVWIEPLREGEEPRLIYRDVQRIISNPVDWVYLDQDIQFELSRVSEYGQLRVSVYDEYDRPVAINSVDLLLLSMGPSAITPSNIRSEPIVIRQPTKNQLIQGGKVIVSGLVRPSEEFLLVELVAADGSVPGYRQVFVTPAPDGSYVEFAVEVPYKVDKGTWVRLRVSESGTRISGMEHLSSVEVYLSP